MAESGSSTDRTDQSHSDGGQDFDMSGKRRRTFPFDKEDGVSRDDNREPVTGGNCPTEKKLYTNLFKAAVKVAVFSNKVKTQSRRGSESEDTMKRRQSEDISRVQVRQRAGRMSMANIYNRDTNIKNHSYLLSAAIREDVQKRRLLARFQFLIRFRMLLHRWWKRYSITDVSSTHPLYMQFDMIDDLTDGNDPAGNVMDFKASFFKANTQMRMSQEAKRILTMKPDDRTDAEVYYAMIALRGIESIAEYPLRMQKALARHGMFDSYGTKRIIVKQGHSPIWFYFILFGKVVVATMDNGSTYAKTRVTLKRGENFGELAIAHRTARQSTVITMEYTEFLTIDCDTYENIFMAGGVKTIHDPDHNRFMRSMFFLKDWPLEKLENNTKAMQFCFFRRNTVMVKDSNCSDWIYIVKSGSLKVYKKLVKCYPTVNKRTGNYREVANADGYFSFLSQENQYHRYAVYNNIAMPPPLSPGDADSDDGEGDQSDEKENLLSLPLMQRVDRLIRPRTAAAGVIATYGESTRPRNKRQVRSAKPLGNRSTSLRSTAESPDVKTETLNDDEQGKRTLIDDFEGGSKGKTKANMKGEGRGDIDMGRLFGLIPSREEVELLLKQEEDMAQKRAEQEQQKCVHVSSDVNPHMINTQQTTFVTKLKKEMTAADLDPEFVLVQTLTKGQAFGLQQIFLEAQPSMFLVSHGAECVMINKKFYKDNVDPNAETRLKQQISPYPTDQQLQEKLRTRVNWERYRQINLENLVSQQKSGRPSKLKHKDKQALFT